MRIGILTIGSLYWDQSDIRSNWRKDRLESTGERRVRVPIRYGRRSNKRGNTFTMVFAMSCSATGRLGTGLVLPARADCTHPQHLIEEAAYLWAAESNSSPTGRIASTWGRVCLLCNPAATPRPDVLQAWRQKVRAAGASYRAIPPANGEDELLEVTTGCARFGWPIDDNTGQPLVDFDLLLMTATEPTLNNGQYPTARQIADAWRADNQRNVSYFCNNRSCGIATFEDDQILAALGTTS
jgi:hypothetical protein